MSNSLAAVRTPPVRRPGPRPIPAAPIRADEVYHANELCRRLGWSKGALRTARRAGLVMIPAGGRLYCIGADLIAYMRGLVDANTGDRPQ